MKHHPVSYRVGGLLKNRLMASAFISICVISIVLIIAPDGRPGFAEEAKTTNKDSNVFTLGEVSVTAENGKSPDTTTGISADDMRQFNRDTVGAALDLVPGVTLSQTGPRNEQTLYVRGLDIKHIPIFIDGIPVYVMYDGYPDLGRFYTYDLSKIEISKGFSSVLYGPNTMGGAINMVTRRPEKPFEMEAGAGAASGDTYSAYTNIGSRMGSWYVQGGASYVDQSYFPLSSSFTPVKSEDGGHRDNSYHTDWKGDFKIGYVPAGRKDDEYAFSYIKQNGEKGSPPYTGTDPSQTVRYWQWPQWDKESYYFTSKTGVGDKSYVKSRLYYDTYQNSLFSYDDATYTTISKKYAFRSWYDDHTVGGSIEAGTGLVDGHSIKTAFHYKEDIHKEHNEGEPWRTFQDDVFSIGLEDTFDLTRSLYSIAGVSYDRINAVKAQDYNSTTQAVSDFPMSDTSSTNAQVGLFYTLPGTGVLHASVAGKSRLPDIKSRYSYRLGTAIPNPYLEPEKSINYEIGYQDNFINRISMKTNVFYNDISDYIQLVTIPDPGNAGKTTTQNQNVGKVVMYGAEAEMGVRIMEHLDSGLTYTYTGWDNKSNSNKITDIPAQKATLYLKYNPLDPLTLQTNVEYDSRRFSSTDGNRVADGYIVTNAKVQYRFNTHFSGEIGVNNIFDKNYQISEGYPEEGVNYFANIVYRY